MAHRDGEQYDLLAWCVMPNHVHAVISSWTPLERIVHSWKSYTAHVANGVLGLQGRFWAREYFDHIIRTEEELERTVVYVLDNPGKAGLNGWRWVGMKAPS